jgi:hypothetical protein
MTNKISISFIKILIGLILGAATAISVPAQSDDYAPGAKARYAGYPQQTLSGVIRVPKAFGIMPSGPGSKEAMALPCGGFYVAAMDPDIGNRLIASTSVELKTGRDDGGFYTCKYKLTLPANKRLYVIAGMGGVLLLPQQSRDPMYITDAWIGGTNNKPRRGYERGFAGKYVTLKKAMGSYIHFDLYYAQVDPN